MVQNKRILDRVKKLLTLGDSDKNDNANEAMQALQSAYDLMKQHGISMAQVKDSTEKEEVKMWVDDERSQYDTWSRILASSVSMLFHCKCIIHKKGASENYRVRISFIGQESDVALCVDVWNWLVKFAKKSSKDFAGSKWSPSHRSFCEAFAYTIHRRCREIIDRESHVSGESDQQWALVVQDKSTAVDDFVNLHFPKTKKNTIRNSGKKDYPSMIAGQLAGERVELNFKSQIGNCGNHSQNTQD